MKPIVHVVDDDESLRTALLRLLNGNGFEATGYGSTGEFLYTIVSETFTAHIEELSLLPGIS